MFDHSDCEIFTILFFLNLFFAEIEGWNVIISYPLREFKDQDFHALRESDLTILDAFDLGSRFSESLGSVISEHRAWKG